MKNKMRRIRTAIFIAIILLLILFSNKVYAIDGLELKTIEPTEEYKWYTELSDEEKQKVLEPKKYNVISPGSNSEYLKSLNNVLKINTLLEDSLQSSYDLRNIIPNNVVVRNQMQTDSCWAFAGIGMLESNLAMLDYKAGNTEKVYDLSERHMFYGAKRNFFNDSKYNEYGYSSNIAGGNFREVRTYLTNGMGAVEEFDMPFANSDGYIDISEIQNKDVVTTLYDTIEFEDVDDIGQAQLMSKMKQTITNYGGIFAGVHGAQILSDAYNNSTGAIYCNNEITYPMNHAVVIIGWDDNYSKDNFNETNKPENNGAWIVKNSWGSELTANLLEEKQYLYEELTEECNENGWKSAEEIPDEIIRQLYIQLGYGEDKVSIDGENIVVEVGNEGYMYISYEDANIYDNLYAVKKATNEKDYDNLYQNDKILADIPITISSNEVFIANKFNRDTNETETLDKIGFYTIQEVTCNVYVNSSDSDLSNSELKKVNLKNGNDVVVQPGYHILELAEPIELTGNSFSVALELCSSDGEVYFMAETRETDENAEINANESFFTSRAAFNVNQWVDLGTYDDEDVRGNVSIKAYTQNEETEEVVPTLERIEVTTKPNKTEYTEGESFDKTGMKISAVYSDSNSKEVTNYEIIDGDNLYYGQSYVTIKYTEDGISKTTTQDIQVNQKDVSGDVNVTDVKISKLPNKLEYIQNVDELDLTGGILEVTYSDGSKTQIDMRSSYVTVSGFDNTKLGKQTIVITYMNRELTFEIEVVNKVKPVLSDFSNMNTSVNEVSVYLFTNSDEEAYLDMKLEISNISSGSDETNYTYYYYFSTTDSEENIENWTKIESPAITKGNDGVKTLSFNINSKDIPNYSQLQDADRLYIYIKEEANASDETLEQIVVDEIEQTEDTVINVYNNNEPIGSIDDVINIEGNNHNSANNNSENVDNTVATGIIPQAGVISIGIAIIILLGIGVYTFIRHRNIDK